MDNSFKKHKNKIFASLAILFTGLLTCALVFTNIGFKPSLFGAKAGQSYQLILNSSNSVSTAGDHDQYTLGGGKVAFTYSNVAASSGNHVRLNENGYLVNKDQITSIESIQVHFSKSSDSTKLTLKASYDGATWGTAWNAEDNETYYLNSSYPYYVQLTAVNGSVDVSSVTYKYTCTANPAANINLDITEESWDRVTNTNELSNGDEIVIARQNSTYQDSGYFSLQNATMSGYDYWLQGASINLSDDEIKAEVDEETHSVWTLLTGSTSGKWKIKCGDNYLLGETKTVSGSTKYNIGLTTSYSSSKCDWQISFSDNRAHLKCGSVYLYLRQYNSGAGFEFSGGSYSDNYGYIFKKTPAVDNSYYNTPVDIIGFTATEANSNSYTTNSIFANENELVVKAKYNTGAEETLSMGENGYTYVIKDSSGNTIDPTAKFPVEGQYTLTVSYGNYIPQEITLNVGEYVYPVDIAASMSVVTFNTADTLGNLEGKLTATITYSNGDVESNIAYSEFASYGVGAKLITPKGFTYDMTKPFGTAGTWNIRIYSIDDENTYYDVGLTVNAIPVETITLSESSYSLYPEESLQLVASINPNTATNTDIVWSSNNTSVATVDENGKVYAVSTGGATITATAADGSNVFGTCVINVLEPPEAPDYTLVTDTSSLSNGDHVVVTTIRSTTPIQGVTGFNGTKDATTSETESNWVQFVVGNKSANGWTLYDSTEQKYIANPTTNEFKYSTSGGTCSVDSTGALMCNSRYLCQNSTYYRFYNSKGSYTVFYVYSLSGGSAAPITVTYPTAITLSGTNSISIGSTSQLTVNYTPAETNVKNVTYSSSAASVATVSNTGLITGVSAGTATITATAEAENNTTISTTFVITVTPVAVTSVSLDTNSTSVKVGKTTTLIATVYPNNATNKAVAWSSSNTSIATVSNTGVVTGVSAGTATITVTTSDGSKTATCTVTVVASSGEETFTISYTDLPTAYQTGTTVYTADSGIKFQAYNCANYSSKMQWKASSGYLQTTEELVLQSITLNDRESNTLTVYGSNTAGSFTTEISGNNDVYDLTGYSYFKVARTTSGAAYCSSITVVTGTPTPTDPTSIILSPTSADVGIGGTKQLSVSYVPSNANQNKEITWTSSNTNVATVSNDGLISVKSTATAGQTATITARLTNLTSIYATCTITVVEQQKDDHTVLLYICGADLESKNSLATGDIQEILKVSGQPDDVNIVIETGGASSWASTYGISSSKLERWHVENKSLVKDASLTYASMGLTSTLQSFIEYGLNNYPAERTGLVLWNHGGGMYGVCYDEKKSDDSLLDNEVKSAVSGALSNCSMSGQKLEWIGYDACLMQVQDIAEINSQYFNYMVASEESEAGYGWDYDNWVDDLYAKKTTPTILKAICDSFISDNGGVNSSSSDQTLSYLDLSKAAAYKTAWENMAAQLQSKLTSSNKSTFNTAIVNNVKHFADDDYDYFCLFDAKDFINKLASNSAFSSFRIDSSYTTAVLNAHADLVAYSTAQKGAGNAYGLCMYWCNNSTYSDMSVYTTSHTNFTTWRSINSTYGTHK